MIKAKRFWKDVTVEPQGEAFAVFLDQRKLMTPVKNQLLLPSQVLAEKIAQEWRAVEGEIQPQTMPFTKRANSAQERVASQRSEIESHLCEYVMNDLICYRAEGPEELREMQAAWDEWCDWAKRKGIALVCTTGIMPVAQAPENQNIVRNWLSKWSDFELTAIYDFITITGSFVLAMAIAEGELDIERAFWLSRIDSHYQNQIWGEDEDEVKVTQLRREELVDSYEFFLLTKSIGEK